jgi:hypothetical protein
MKKNILHIEISTEKNNKNFIGPELLLKFIDLLESKLGNNFKVVTSPGKAELYSDEYRLYNFEVNQLSKEEFFKLINQ